MIASIAGTKQRWVAAVVTGLAAGAAAVILFRAPPLVIPEVRPPAKAVELKKVTAEQSTLGEQAVMRDLTPLFLPTERNASLRRMPAREPGQSIMDIEAAKLGIADAGWRYDDYLPPVITLNDRKLAEATPLDYLEASARDASAAGMGRAKRAVVPLDPRGGIVEVVRQRDGQRVLVEELKPDLRPPTDKVWQPMEFLAVVGRAGLVAPLSITSRSGVDEVDIFFGNYLVRTLRVGELLTPGFYRITVAP